MQDVADTLRALEADARNLRAEAVAEDLAVEVRSTSAKKQFAAGGISHVQFLIVERQYSQAHQSRVQAQAARYSDSAALFQARGGGWWNRKDQEEKVTASSEQRDALASDHRGGRGSGCCWAPWSGSISSRRT